MGAPKGNKNAAAEYPSIVTRLSGKIISSIHEQLAREGEQEPSQDQIVGFVQYAILSASGKRREKQMMRWQSEEDAYRGVTSVGKVIRVKGIEMAESAEDIGVDLEELSRLSCSEGNIELSDEQVVLLDPDQWAMCIGANQNVSYVYDRE